MFLAKNTASQVVNFCLVKAADGTALTGATVSVRRCLDGTFAATTGSVTEDSAGLYKFAPSQADTNGNQVAYYFTATSAVPVCLNLRTTAADMSDSVRFGLTALPNAAASAVGGLPLAVDSSGRVDVLKVNGTSQTARDLGASVLLSSGTGTGQLDFTSGVVKANVTQLLGTAWLTPGVAGTPDVNVKSINAVSTSPVTTIKAVQGLAVDGVVTTLTNLPAITAGWLTATGIAADAITAAKVASDVGAEIATAVWTDTTAGDFTAALSVGKSVMNGVSLGTGLTVARCTLTDTISAYTGNTPQTGDSYARIGAAGAGLTNVVLPSGGLANVTAWTVALTGNVTGNLSGSVGSVTGAVGSVTGAVGSVTGAVGSVTARVTANTDQLAGQTVTAAAGVTFPASVGTSTLTQTQVSGGAYAINSSSFAFNAALDFTAAQKAATLARVTLADTISAYTGNTPQTGDVYARVPTNFESLLVTGTGRVQVGGIDTGQVSSSAVSAAAATKIGAALVDLLTSGHTTSGTFGEAIVAAAATLGAAGVRSAVGLAAANLDTQIATLATPTNITAGTMTTVTNLTNLPAAPTDWLSAAAVSAAAANKLADINRRRTQANVEASSFGDTLSGHSLYGAIQQMQASNTTAHAGKLTIFMTDLTTELVQLTLATDADAEAVTGVQ